MMSPTGHRLTVDDLRIVAREYLPMACLDSLDVRSLGKTRFEVSAAIPYDVANKVDHSLPRMVQIGRDISDDFEKRGIFLAFDAQQTLGPGVRLTFQWVS